MTRILVIEDDLETCDLIKDVLGREGYEVSIAVTGREGINLVKRRPPDLVICNLVMEGLDGIGVLTELENIGRKIPIIMVSAYGIHDRVIQALELGAVDFITKPFKSENLIQMVKKNLELITAKPEDREKLLKEKVSPIHRLLRDSYMSTLKSLAVIMESKDPYIREHSLRVTKYAVMLARELGLNIEEIGVIENTGLFHDIGKIGVSDTILQKVEELTAEEWDQIKKHPEIGYDIVEPLKLLHIALPGIRHHHERFDGKGYPDRLKGKEIPLIARILAVADAYEAMTATRPYRKAKRSEEAVKELKKSSGTQFDPKLVEIFIKAIKKSGEV